MPPQTSWCRGPTNKHHRQAGAEGLQISLHRQAGAEDLLRSHHLAGAGQHPPSAGDGHVEEHRAAGAGQHSPSAGEGHDEEHPRDGSRGLQISHHPASAGEHEADQKPGVKDHEADQQPGVRDHEPCHEAHNCVGGYAAGGQVQDHHWDGGHAIDSLAGVGGQGSPETGDSLDTAHRRGGGGGT